MRRVRQSCPASACSSPYYNQPEPGAYLQDSSPSSAGVSIYLFKPRYAIGSVPSLSGHAIAYRWRSLPRVPRHGASKPQGSSKRVLPWEVTMDKLICASLSHTPYGYEGGMLKVPAVLLLIILCLCFLPVYSGRQACWTYQPGSHRMKVTQDFSSTFFLRYLP